MCVRLSDIVLYVIACSSVCVCVCASFCNDMISCVLLLKLCYPDRGFKFF